MQISSAAQVDSACVWVAEYSATEAPRIKDIGRIFHILIWLLLTLFDMTPVMSCPP
jgi:hypothetical protein